MTGLVTSGCGRQAFVVGRNTTAQSAPGTFFIPPKVDFLLVQDDTGSMAESHAHLAAQMPEFLKQLEKKGWDFHFTATALTNDQRPITQIAGSRYDANWGPLWTPAYPGIDPDHPDSGMIFPQFFRKISNFSEFLSHGEINNSLGGYEPGFLTIHDALFNRLADTSFHRKDSVLVVLVVGNGNDTSLVNMCRRSDDLEVPCEQIQRPACTSLNQVTDVVNNANCASASLSFNAFLSEFKQARSNPKQVKFYSAVADSPNYSGTCLAGNSRAGVRYKAMSQALGGRSFDVCTRSITSVLSSLSSELQAQRVSFETRYLFLEEEPDPNTIEVTRYRNGQAELLPEDPDNGWTYVGYVENVYAIDAPIELNLSSGWAIRLNGNAKLIGDDRADVSYKSAGVSDSVSN